MKDIRKPSGYIEFEYEESAFKEIEIPAVYEVCDRCHGEGKHSNPAIDGNGISSEELLEDPDFMESYFSGFYDVPCEVCRGVRVVPAPDFTRLDDDTARKVQRALDAKAEFEREERYYARLRERGIEY